MRNRRSRRHQQRRAPHSQSKSKAQEKVMLNHSTADSDSLGLFFKYTEGTGWVDVTKSYEYVAAKKVNDDLEDERIKLEEKMRQLTTSDAEVLRIRKRLRILHELKTQAHKKMVDAWLVLKEDRNG